MRVLLVNDLPPGPGSGAEVHVALLVDALEAAGDIVEVFVATTPHTGARLVLDVWDPGARRRLAAVGRSFHPDVVHHHNVLRELSVAVLGMPVGVPSVLTLHDHRLLGARDAGPRRVGHDLLVAATSRWARAVVRRRIDAVVALNDEMATLLRGAGFGRVERVDLFAADPGPVPCPAGAGTDIVFAGRLAPDKGAAALADAFARVAARHPACRLVLAGDGPERAAIEAVAAALPGQIRLVGRVGLDEVHRLMAGARAVAVPSVQALRPEGGPTTILEAALRARPVITTEGVPLASLVTASGGGIVIPPQDPARLATALDELLTDANRATEAGEAARRFALGHHVPAVVVPHLRALYADLVEGPAR